MDIFMYEEDKMTQQKIYGYARVSSQEQNTDRQVIH